MAINKERLTELIELYKSLPKKEKDLTFDFVKLLEQKQLQEFYDSLEEVEEQFSEEELLQMQDTERVSLDELAKEMGWHVESNPQQASE